LQDFAAWAAPKDREETISIPRGKPLLGSAYLAATAKEESRLLLSSILKLVEPSAEEAAVARVGLCRNFACFLVWVDQDLRRDHHQKTDAILANSLVYSLYIKGSLADNCLEVNYLS